MDLDNNAIRRFDWVDYLIFVTILIISSLIGVYHAYKGSSGSTSQYLLGGKEMGIVPIALSLAARYSAFSNNSLKFKGSYVD